ncbi:MAG: hypothetical protein UU21_C0002G0003 [Candidatus Levybacteria bacterium GW2011_GWA2_40_8]|nr:MAG: hypothetical protein UU21_C0002G0003 [Candidatus Levybacteria bacterium GW2011_GWA2_40_8]
MICLREGEIAMDPNNTTDPLAAILVDETTKRDRAREILAAILKDRVEINSTTGELELLPKAYEISVANTILILLCGKLAQKLLFDQKKTIDEKMSQSEIGEFLTSVEYGTVKSSLHNLRGQHLIKNENGKNFVAMGQLQKIKDSLAGRNKT